MVLFRAPRTDGRYARGIASTVVASLTLFGNFTPAWRSTIIIPQIPFLVLIRLPHDRLTEKMENSDQFSIEGIVLHLGDSFRAIHTAVVVLGFGATVGTLLY